LIPTLIFVGLLIGLATRLPAILLAAIILLGAAWAGLVAGFNDADFIGGFAFGAVNAAVGVVFGAGLRAITEAVADQCRRQRSRRLSDS
jgi:hypothetical protein